MADGVREGIAAGELVEVLPQFRPEPMPLPIVHEDDDLMVIDKPAGLVVHPGAGNPEGTMLNALLHHAREVDRAFDLADHHGGTRFPVRVGGRNALRQLVGVAALFLLLHPSCLHFGHCRFLRI